MSPECKPRRDEVDVLVVGGGPCGLSATYAAARRGLSVEVIEASPHLGGMAASFSVRGQRVDYGSHRLHPTMPPHVRSLLDDLMGPDLQVRPRNGRLRLRDRWVAFPLRVSDLITSMPPALAAASACDLLTRPLRRHPAVSYADVVLSGLGDTALSEFHGPMAHKLWGVPAEQLDASLAHKRISVRSPSRLAKTILHRQTGRTFLYPRLGYGQIVESLAHSAEALGARLTIDTTVRSLAPGSHTVVELSDQRRVEARRVLWTAPRTALATATAAPGETHSVPMRSLVLVYLVLPVNRYTEFDAHYVPDREVAFSRLSEPRNYRDGPDPGEQTVLCAEIPANTGDHCWTAGDDELAAMVTDGMARCDLPEVPIDGIEVRRLPSVYPVLMIPGTGNPAGVPEPSETQGVTLLGRQGLSVADNLHHVIDMGLSAIDCVGDDGAWDASSWAAHRERFDGFVVED
ncbi:MAG: Ferredoxin--NADP reductase [Acidimicrobiaceae bacterium]|nr:Ferredoxin--NADP reductase [Acidimicrobiaceae bacterium]